MKRAISQMMFLAIGIICSAQNLIINPGFESWNKINKPAGWSTSQLCVKDSVTYITGNYSCRHEGTISATKSVGQKLAILPGKQYMFSFFYKTVVSGSEHGCRIWCHWEDADSKLIIDPFTEDILQPSSYMKSDNWQQYSTDITSPANSCYFVLEIRTYQNSIAFFDDFVFTETISTGKNEHNESVPEIYPNPVHDYLIINNIQNFKHISIMTLNGSALWSYELSGEQVITVPVSGIADGIYIIRIATPGKLITRKFIKN